MLNNAHLKEKGMTSMIAQWKGLSVQAWGPGFNPWHMCRRLSMIAHMYHLSIREVGTGKALGLAGEPAKTNQPVPGPWERPCLKEIRWTSSLHTHMCTCVWPPQIHTRKEGRSPNNTQTVKRLCANSLVSSMNHGHSQPCICLGVSCAWDGDKQTSHFLPLLFGH